MEDDLKYFQNQITKDIAEAEKIILASRELAKYLNLDHAFFDELELTSMTLEDILQRISKALDAQYISSFSLAIKQIRMMAIDLLFMCKEKMISA